MPYCPKCDSRISELNEYNKGEEKHRFYVADNGGIETEYLDWIGEGSSDYECPECKEVLFTGYNDAEAFLRRIVCDDCRVEIKEKKEVIEETMREKYYYFCSEGCQDNFKTKFVAQIL